jgi:hypothetical protein
MSMALGLVFTIEVDGKPTVAFEAKSLREASELCRAEWLRADLSALKSGGSPLCNSIAKLKVRVASEAERQVYRSAEQVVQASDDLVLAYLVDLDGLGPSGECKRPSS